MRSNRVSDKMENNRKEDFMPDQEFFMQIKKPVWFRKTTLEASKSVLTVLKGLQTIKDVRQQKMEKLELLSSEVKEIRLLMQKAEELMPKYSRQETAKHFPQLNQQAKTSSKIQMKKAAEPIVVVQRKLSELDLINQSLASVESRMKQLPGAEKKATDAVEKKPSAPQKPLAKSLDSIHRKLKEL